MNLKIKGKRPLYLTINFIIWATESRHTDNSSAPNASINLQKNSNIKGG